MNTTLCRPIRSGDLARPKDENYVGIVLEFSYFEGGRVPELWKALRIDQQRDRRSGCYYEINVYNTLASSVSYGPLRFLTEEESFEEKVKSVEV